MAAPKPTIEEYDRVYGVFRQNDLQQYRKLRTWILDQVGSGGNVVSITYANLITLFNGGTMIPGTIYCITNFRSRNEIPNAGGAVAVGAIEPICVTAVSATDLAPIAVSTTNQFDILIYEIDNTDFGADLGRILYRRDLQGNESGFDFRAYQFRRWETINASGVFDSVTDTGFAFTDGFAFDFVNSNAVRIDPFYVAGAQLLSNNVIVGIGGAGGVAVNVWFQAGSADNTLQAGCSDVTFGSLASVNRLNGFCEKIEIRRNADTNFIDISCESVIIDALANNVTIGSNCNSIFVGSGCNIIDIADNSSTVTIGESGNTIDLQGQADRVVIGANCLNVTVTGAIVDFECGGAASTINIGVTNNQISIGPDSSNITIGDNNNDISMGSSSSGITIGSTNSTIDIGHGCATIVTGDGCSIWNVASGTSDRTMNANQSNRRDTPSDAYYNITYDFAASGGAIGTINLDQVANNASVRISNVKVTTALASATNTATLAIGIDVDAAAGIVAAALITAAPYTGPVTNGINDGASANIQPNNGTTAARNFIFTIAVENITAGVLILMAEVIYPD